MEWVGRCLPRHVLSENTCCEEKGTLERNQHPRDNYKRPPKARVSDSAALFSGSPENPTVSKEMVARKTEKKYRRTIYRIITVHRNPMTRGYSKRERRSSFQHVRHAEGILIREKWSRSLRSLRFHLGNKVALL